MHGQYGPTSKNDGVSRLRFFKKIFLAVQESSIGDLVPQSLSHSVTHSLTHYHDNYNYNDYKDYNDYSDYNDYNDYNDCNDYRNSDLD